MGIPYSRQINAAFEQVSPLVVEGFEVLQATQRISLLIAEIQVLTTLVLLMILVTLIALVICVNPDLETERQALVTPVIKYLASFAMTKSGQGQFGLVALFTTLTFGGLAYAHWYYYFKQPDIAELAQSEGDAQPQPEDTESTDGSGGDPT